MYPIFRVKKYMNKKTIYKSLKDIAIYFLGALIYSSAVTMFVSSNEISPGGVTGIATALNYLFSLVFFLPSD